VFLYRLALATDISYYLIGAHTAVAVLRSNQYAPSWSTAAAISGAGRCSFAAARLSGQKTTTNQAGNKAVMTDRLQIRAARATRESQRT